MSPGGELWPYLQLSWAVALLASWSSENKGPDHLQLRVPPWAARSPLTQWSPLLPLGSSYPPSGHEAVPSEPPTLGSHPYSIPNWSRSGHHFPTNL